MSNEWVYSLLITHYSFGSQTLHRVRYRRSHCLHTYCRQSDDYREQASSNKNPPAYVYSVCIILQPSVHNEISKRRRYHKSDYHQFYKIF